jgi:hypothetical protein
MLLPTSSQKQKQNKNKNKEIGSSKKKRRTKLSGNIFKSFDPKSIMTFPKALALFAAVTHGGCIKKFFTRKEKTAAKEADKDEVKAYAEPVNRVIFDSAAKEDYKVEEKALKETINFEQNSTFGERYDQKGYVAYQDLYKNFFIESENDASTDDSTDIKEWNNESTDSEEFAKNQTLSLEYENKSLYNRILALEYQPLLMLEDEKENADQILEATSTENIVTDMVVNYEDSTDTNTLVKAVIETNESDDEYVDPKDVAFAKEFAKTKAEQKQKLRDWFQQEEEKDKAFAKEFAKTKAEQKQKQRDWFQEEEKKEKDFVEKRLLKEAEQKQAKIDLINKREDGEAKFCKEFKPTKEARDQEQIEEDEYVKIYKPNLNEWDQQRAMKIARKKILLAQLYKKIGLELNPDAKEFVPRFQWNPNAKEFVPKSMLQ